MPIELRHRTYFAYLDVPADVREKLGRRVFRQTLKTDSRSVAERRAAPLVAQWKAEIARLREEPNHDDAKFWRDALRRAGSESERTFIIGHINMAATPEERLRTEALSYRSALRQANTIQQRLEAETSIEMHALTKLDTDAEERRFYGLAYGSVIPTTEHLDEWIGSLQVKAKTAGMRRAAVERLAAKCPTLQGIDRKEVRRWITELLADVKPATVQRMTSDCRNYWRYLATIEAVPEDSAPFDRLGLKVKQASWLPYTPQEGARLLKAADSDVQLADLVRMAMYTGARREELCSLKAEHVAGDRFSIVDAKTEAGVRTVPIHRRIAATIKRLVKGSRDGYLLSGLKPNKNGDRGDMLGKRFTRLKQSLGFSDRHTFHSWRGTVITILEHAGVPEGTVQDIVGHERSTLTGSTYSGKSTFEMRRAALAKLSYPVGDSL